MPVINYADPRHTDAERLLLVADRALNVTPEDLEELYLKPFSRSVEYASLGRGEPIQNWHPRATRSGATTARYVFADLSVVVVRYPERAGLDWMVIEVEGNEMFSMVDD